MNSQSSLHAVIIFLIATLGGYLEAVFQSKSTSLFDEHKNIMVAIYVSLSTYGVGLIAEYKLGTQNYFRLIRIIRRFTPLIGILVAVLLLVISLPLLGLVTFIIWALFMLEAMIKSVQETLQWLHRVILHGRQIITTYFRSSGGNHAMNEENGSTGGEVNGSLPD